jgi:hypothetical protein
VGWTSTDGECWEPVGAPVGGSEALLSEQGILLFDHATFPEIWLATHGIAGSLPQLGDE